MWEIIGYDNVESLYGIFNGIAAISGNGNYLGAIKISLLFGFTAALLGYAFNLRATHGWQWMLGVIVVMNICFTPKVTVAIIDKLNNTAPRVVDNVPLALGVLGSVTSKVGDTVTTLFETAFQTIPSADAELPQSLSYQGNGIMFGVKLLKQTQESQIKDQYLKADLTNFVANCTLYDLSQGLIDANAFNKSTDVWSVMATTNMARFTTITSINGVNIAPCPTAYTSLNVRLIDEIPIILRLISKNAKPAMSPILAEPLVEQGINDFYAKSLLSGASSSAGELIRQNAVLRAIGDGAALSVQKSGDPTPLLLSMAQSQATASTNAAYITQAKMAEESLPLIRNVIEGLIYACFPLLILLVLAQVGKAVVLALKGYLIALTWIQLWPPLYAVANYFQTQAIAKKLAAAGLMSDNTRGLSLETAASVYGGSLSDMAVSGWLIMALVPISWALVQSFASIGSVVASGLTQMASTAARSADTASQGNISQGNISFDQHNMSPNKSLPNFSSETSVDGTSVYGVGNGGATAFRYAQRLSSLEIAPNVSERASAQLSEEASQAAQIAQSKRESASQARAAALTEMMNMSENYRMSQGASNASSIDGTSQDSSATEKLLSVAKTVNRAIGLDENSTVGKKIAATVALGIPISDKLKVNLGLDGSNNDTETLKRAYGIAETSMRNTSFKFSQQDLEAFKNSEAYQATRQSSKDGTSGYDSKFERSNRESIEAANLEQYSQQRAEAARLMRENALGMNTALTTAFVQQLHNTGRWRTFQNADLEGKAGMARDFADQYIQGGIGAKGTWVPFSGPKPNVNSMLQRSKDELQGELKTTLDQFGKPSVSDRSVEEIRDSNNAVVKGLQHASGVTPGSTVPDQVSKKVADRKTTAKAEIEREHGEQEKYRSEAASEIRHNTENASWFHKIFSSGRATQKILIQKAESIKRGENK